MVRACSKAAWSGQGRGTLVAAAKAVALVARLDDWLGRAEGPLDRIADALLRRLRHQQPPERIYAPEFLRELEEPIAGAIGVDAQTRLVITEGNYLLLEQGHWAEVAGLLDAVWYVEPDEPLRLQRLLQRHMAFGRSEQAARDWIASTDEPNARLIEASRPRADWVLRWND